MIAIISVPPSLAARVGGDLCRGKRGVPTYETPHRVYFVVPLIDLKGRGPFYLRPDITIEWFPTREDAMAWGIADATTREVVQ